MKHVFDDDNNTNSKLFWRSFEETLAQVDNTTFNNSITMHVRVSLLGHELEIEKEATFPSHQLGIGEDVLYNWKIKLKLEESTPPLSKISTIFWYV